MDDRIELRIPTTIGAMDVHLVEWLADNGEAVAMGQPVFAVESDKAVLEVSSPGAGILQISAAAGERYPPDLVVGTLKQK